MCGEGGDPARSQGRIQTDGAAITQCPVLAPANPCNHPALGKVGLLGRLGNGPCPKPHKKKSGYDVEQNHTIFHGWSFSTQHSSLRQSSAPSQGPSFSISQITILINESQGPILLLPVSLKILPVNQVWWWAYL